MPLLLLLRFAAHQPADTYTFEASGGGEAGGTALFEMLHGRRLTGAWSPFLLIPEKLKPLILSPGERYRWRPTGGAQAGGSAAVLFVPRLRRMRHYAHRVRGGAHVAGSSAATMRSPYRVRLARARAEDAELMRLGVL